MNLDHLRYFLVLAETEHYSKASEKLNISQPSLSYAVSQLEEELGVPLFEKKGRGITLSRAGREFLKTVKSSVNILDEGTRVVKEEGINGRYISIGSIRVLGTTLVPSLMRAFKEAVHYPVKFTLSSGNGFSSSILKAVEEKKLDYGFTTIPGDPAVFETVPFIYSRFVVITPVAHPLAEKERVTLPEALSYPLVMFSENAGLRKSIDVLISRTGLTPEIAIESEEDDVVAGLVAEGFGIAVLPYTSILESLGVKILEIDDTESGRTAYLSRLKGITLPPAAEAFWNYAISKLDKEVILKYRSRS